MTDFISRPLFLLIMTALAYVGSTIAMKSTASQISPFAVLSLALFLAAAGTLEVLVLRQVSLAAAYLTIIGLEALLILLYGIAIGEGLSLREFAGGALVLVGAVVLTR
jgi:multidrug transporter EmrE-like cation transporter